MSSPTLIRKGVSMNHVVRAFAVIVASLLFSSCSGTGMNVMLDLRSSVLVFDSDFAHPEFDVVRLNYPGNGLSSWGASTYGAPETPELSLQVALPPYVHVESVAAIPISPETVAGPFRLMPQQPHRALPSVLPYLPHGDVAPLEFVPPLPEIYDSVKPYPPKLLGYVMQGEPFGFNVEWVNVYPVQYIPRDGKLIFYRQFQFVFTLAPDSSSYVPGRVQPSEVVRRDLEDSIRSMVINPEDVSRFAPWGG